MTLMERLASVPEVQTLGGTLLHFLWQGLLVALLLKAALALTDSRSAGVRYRLACAALLGVKFPIPIRRATLRLAPSICVSSEKASLAPSGLVCFG